MSVKRSHKLIGKHCGGKFNFLAVSIIPMSNLLTCYRTKEIVKIFSLYGAYIACNKHRKSTNIYMLKRHQNLSILFYRKHNFVKTGCIRYK